MWLLQHILPYNWRLWFRTFVVVLLLHGISSLLFLGVYSGQHSYVHICMGSSARAARKPVYFSVSQKSVATTTQGGTPMLEKKETPKKTKPVQSAQSAVKSVKKESKSTAKKTEKNEAPKKKTKKEPVVKKDTRDKKSHTVQEKQEPAYIGQRERDALEIERVVHAELEKVWRPPVGLSKELICSVAATVDWHGSLQSYTMVEASGVLLYDISVQSAIRSLQFPKLVHGKTITITFKQ